MQNHCIHPSLRSAILFLCPVSHPIEMLTQLCYPDNNAESVQQQLVNMEADEQGEAISDKPSNVDGAGTAKVAQGGPKKNKKKSTKAKKSQRVDDKPKKSKKKSKKVKKSRKAGDKPKKSKKKSKKAKKPQKADDKPGCSKDHLRQDSLRANDAQVQRKEDDGPGKLLFIQKPT